jgi:beta-lactamase superfamily II metal-dependent hydrolase
VGNGDAIVLRFPDGTWGIVDSCYVPGTGTAAALPLLRQEMLPAKEKIGFACLTHYHYDHYDGLSQIIYRNTVFCTSNGHFYHNGFEWCRKYEQIGWHDIEELTDIRGVMEDPVESPFIDWTVTPAAARHKDEVCADVTCHFIAPTSDRKVSLQNTLLNMASNKKRAPKAFNRIGIAFILKYKKAILLFADDIEKPMWNRIKKRWRWAKPCWVKVSHHGGRSGNPDFLWPWLARSTRKKQKLHAVISADGHDHPNRDVLAEIKKRAHVHATWASPSAGLTRTTPIKTARRRKTKPTGVSDKRSPFTAWLHAVYPDGRICEFAVYPDRKVVPVT